MAVINPISQSRVAERLDAIRAELSLVIDQDERFQHSVTIGKAGQDVPNTDVIPAPVRELLRVANGIRCGEFFIYGKKSAAERGPFYAGFLKESTQKWHAIGEYETTPIFLERMTGSVWFTPDGGSSDFMSVPIVEIAPDIWSFVGWYLLGPGYQDPIFGDDDEWVEFLKEHNLFDWENPV